LPLFRNPQITVRNKLVAIIFISYFDGQFAQLNSNPVMQVSHVVLDAPNFNAVRWLLLLRGELHRLSHKN
jgi:hypothetical protein